MSSSSGDDDGNYVAHFTREEVEERIENGDVDLPADLAILPEPHRKVVKHQYRGARRAGDDPLDNDVFRRILSDGVMHAVRTAIKTDDRATMAYLRGWKEATNEKGALASLLVRRLDEEAMTIAIVDTTNAGKTHELTRLCALSVDWCDYETFVTNVPLRDPDVRIPATWSQREEGGELENQLDPEDVEAGLEWHVNTGLPLQEVVAETEKHARKVAEFVDGRVFIAIDEYGTAGGGAKGGDRNVDRPTVQFARGIRKDPYNASIAFIGHALTDLPPDLRDLIKLGVTKPDKRQVQLWGRAEQHEFQERLSPPFEAGGHRLDDYNDKIQPVWRFKSRDDDEGDDEDEWSEQQLVTRAEERIRAGDSIRDLDRDPDYPRGRTWISNRVDVDDLRD